MCDAQTRVEHTLALAALIQAMVKELCEHFEAGAQLSEYPWQMIDENKWLAARHGLDAELVDLPGADKVAAKALTQRLARPAAPHAQDLGSERELEGIDDLLKRGTGSRRQKLVYEANHDFARSCARSSRPPARASTAPLSPVARPRPARGRAGRRRRRSTIIGRATGARSLRRLQELRVRGVELRHRVPVLRSAPAQAGAEARGASTCRTPPSAPPPRAAAAARFIPARSRESAPIPRTGPSYRSRWRSPAPAARSRRRVFDSADVAVFGSPDGEWWRVATAPFFAEDLWYAARRACCAIVLFGGLLERRHGALAPLLLFVARGHRRHRRRGRARDVPVRGRRQRRGARDDRRLGDAADCATCARGQERRRRPDRRRRLRRGAAADAARRRGGERDGRRRRPARRHRRRRAARPPRVERAWRLSAAGSLRPVGERTFTAAQVDAAVARLQRRKGASRTRRRSSRTRHRAFSGSSTPRSRRAASSRAPRGRERAGRGDRGSRRAPLRRRARSPPRRRGSEC